MSDPEPDANDDPDEDSDLDEPDDEEREPAPSPSPEDDTMSVQAATGRGQMVDRNPIITITVDGAEIECGFRRDMGVAKSLDDGTFYTVCVRCRTWAPLKADNGWSVVTFRDESMNHICPNCQHDEDRADLVINEVLSEAARPTGPCPSCDANNWKESKTGPTWYCGTCGR